jgi:hypothetical protein
MCSLSSSSLSVSYPVTLPLVEAGRGNLGRGPGDILALIWCCSMGHHGSPFWCWSGWRTVVRMVMDWTFVKVLTVLIGMTEAMIA